ncbi:hypothetical protein QQ008_22560 [Fulvivirgaceae bacterium BMA10]|uniref:Uncharacterized protein n=1 Tax=Splendidivirga corallicola TaxID=3051826 RepID=A0ABT8KTT7_9BACT|nr:hypothetical protein [Fulvivirgaceae bacterium BMA10]
MKNKYLTIVLLSLLCFSCKSTNDLDKFIKAIDVGKIGTHTPGLEVEAISNNLYKITTTLNLKEKVGQRGWSIDIHPNFQAEFQWSPHLTPGENYIISDHVFRAPALILASEFKSITVIPDLDSRKKSKYRWFMDLDAPGNKLSIGISDYVVKEHVLFQKVNTTEFANGEIELSFYIMLSKDKKDIQNPWRKPLEFMWEKWGKPLADNGEPLNRPLETYVDHTYKWAFDSWKDAVWQEFELNSKKVGAPVFIVNITQSPNYSDLVSEREFRSIWNNAWFSSLRSAQGLYRYGRRIDNSEYIEKANLTKELALSFPQNNGLFPGLIATEMETVDIKGKKYNRSKGWDTYYFGNSTRNPYDRNPKKAPMHIVDMSWTAYHMLTWYDELEKDERLLQYAIDYAEGLLKLQDGKGYFPTWIMDNGEPSEILPQSPGVSVSVTFLLKLYSLTSEDKYKDAALKAMNSVIEDIIPIGRWEDYETYWSCSRWGSEDLVGKKIERNNMFKQNTLSIYWTAEALLTCYEATGKNKYLELGQRTLDELLMTQQTWQPPFMHVKVFGGFGVMNADGEWNDSRQSLFAELIIRYGKLLNKEEYVQRGIAAVKASFSMMYCPENPESKVQWEARHPFFNEKDYGFMMENYGHGGYTNDQGEGIGVFTIYDWGNGAASEAYNKIIDHYGTDIFSVQ